MQLPGRLFKYNGRVNKNMIPIFLKKTQITIPSFLAIFVVFVVAVFFSGIIILACSQIPESTFSPVSIPPISQDPTANWQTYRNEEYGFEFKYPNDWHLEYQEDDKQVWINNPKDYYTIELIIFIYSKKDGKDTCCADKYLGFTPDSTFILDGETAYKYTLDNYCDAGECSGSYDVISFNHSDTLFVIETNVLHEDPLTNTILSTFKFIEPIDTSNWQTYRNNLYGIEFKTPTVLEDRQGGVWIAKDDSSLFFEVKIEKFNPNQVETPDGIVTAEQVTIGQDNINAYRYSWDADAYEIYCIPKERINLCLYFYHSKTDIKSNEITPYQIAILSSIQLFEPINIKNTELKTYSNNQLKIEFKYPARWDLKERQFENKTIIDLSLSDPDVPVSLPGVEEFDSPKIYFIDIWSGINKIEANNIDCLEKKTEQKDNIKITRCREKKWPDGDGGYIVVYEKINKKLIYSINYWGSGQGLLSEDKELKYFNDFDKILSTFKFLN